MKIQALRGSYGDNGRVRRGQIIDVPEKKAEQLIKRGLFDTPQNIAAAKRQAEKEADEKRQLKVDQQSEGQLRTDGPTVGEYVAKGYLASNYPPEGYASRSSPEEVDAAVEAEKVTAGRGELEKLSNKQLHELAGTEGIAVESDDNKTGLVEKIIAGRAAKG